MSAFTSLVNKEIPAKSTVKRLKKVIDGKDDFNAVNAIKEVNRNMFRHSSELNQSINVENGVFIVPTKSSDGNWEERARKLEQKVIDVKPENEC